MDAAQNKTNTAKSLPWHKPTVQRLAVSLDTRAEVGSYTDFEGGYSEVMLQG